MEIRVYVTNQYLRIPGTSGSQQSGKLIERISYDFNNAEVVLWDSNVPEQVQKPVIKIDSVHFSVFIYTLRFLSELCHVTK